MRMVTSEKANKLYVKMMKLVAMANPANDPEFLDEVAFHAALKCMTSLCFEVNFLNYVRCNSPS